MVKNSKVQKLVRSSIPHGKILIVDDILTNLDVAKGLMEPYEMTIHCASGGAQAIEIVREAKTKYDIIFMDHMMPEVDGMEAVRVIREEIGTEYALNVPVVALTANALVGNQEMFLNSGFQDFLSKPIDVLKLDAVINKWIPSRPEDAPRQVRETGAEADAIGGRSTAELETLGLDAAEGARRYGMKTYLRIIQSYVTHMPQLLDKLRDLTEESLSDYAITIHGIKGASYGISAKKVGTLAEALEKLAKSGNFEAVKQNNAAFIKEAEKLLRALRSDQEVQS
jgi:CheY-like chemotaxis protein